MKGIIKKLLRAYYRYKQVKMWKREMLIESEKIKPDITIKQQIDGRCLVLIPHSDDEWIGCSRIVEKGKDVILCNMDMCGGDTPALHYERFEEMSLVAQDNGRSIITIKENKTEELKKVIIEIKPDYVFLPHFIDWHPEHIEVMNILNKAICDMDLNNVQFHVVQFQVSCPIIRGITHALAMSEGEWKQKWAYFRSHYPSQVHIPYQRFSLNEIINGRYIDAYAAEVYCVMNTSDWIKYYNNNMVTEKQIQELRNCLGSICSMRHYIRNEYSNA